MTPPTDNVIPIDADAARQLARHTRRFRMFVATLAAVWLAALAAVLALGPLPPLAPFAVLAALAVLAEHRFVLFDDETSMSASIIVVVTSVFVFSDTAPFAGPMLVASLGGLYLPLLRRREYTVSLANVSCYGLAAGLAALALRFPGAKSPGMAVGLTAAAATAVVFWVANSLLVSGASSFRQEHSIGANAIAQVRADFHVVILVVAAALAANQHRDSALWKLCIVSVSFIFIWQILLLDLRRAKRGLITAELDTSVLGLVIVASWALANCESQTYASVAATAFFLILALEWQRNKSASAAIASVVVTSATLLGLGKQAASPAIQFATALCLGFVVLTIGGLTVKVRKSRTSVSLLAVAGAAIPSRSDMWRLFIAGLGSALVLTTLELRGDATPIVVLVLIAVSSVGLATCRRRAEQLDQRVGHALPSIERSEPDRASCKPLT